MRYWFIVLFLVVACNEDPVTYDVQGPDDYAINGFVMNYDDVNHYVAVVVTSSSAETDSIIRIDLEQAQKWGLPYPRQRVGMKVERAPVHNVIRIDRWEYNELEYVYQPVLEMRLKLLIYPKAYTDKGVFNYSSLLSDRWYYPPNIFVGDVFRATVQDSILLSIDR